MLYIFHNIDFKYVVAYYIVTFFNIYIWNYINEKLNGIYKVYDVKNNLLIE